MLKIAKIPLDADDKTPGNSVHDQTCIANCTLDFRHVEVE
jgi:hypothetical protein